MTGLLCTGQRSRYAQKPKSRENHGENGAQEHRQAQANNRLEKKLGGVL